MVDGGLDGLSQSNDTVLFLLPQDKKKTKQDNNNF